MSAHAEADSAGQPPPRAPYRPASGPTAGAAPASWGRRAAAGAVDGLPVWVAAGFLAVGYGRALYAAGLAGELAPDWSAGRTNLRTGGVVLLAALVWVAAGRWWAAGRTGQSAGRRLLGLRLVGADTGAPLGVGLVALRDLVHLLDLFSLVGYLWPLWHPRRQTLADLLTRSVVVECPQRERLRRSGLPAARR